MCVVNVCVHAQADWGWPCLRATLPCAARPCMSESHAVGTECCVFSGVRGPVVPGTAAELIEGPGSKVRLPTGRSNESVLTARWCGILHPYEGTWN